MLYYMSNNTTYGTGSLADVSIGTNNTAIGAYSGATITTGNYNVGIGANALLYNSSGNDNTALGTATSLYSLGSYNTSVGANSQEGISDNALISTGNYNSSLGVQSLYNIADGNSNTSIGSYSGFSDISGNYNTSIGYESGYNSTGNNNTFLGSFTDVSSNSVIANSTAIGYNAKALLSNQIVLGTSTEKVYIPGDYIGIGTFNASSTNALDASGNISFSNSNSYLDVSSNSAGIKTSAGLLSNIVMGYLYGTTSNIQTQFNTIDTTLTGVSYSTFTDASSNTRSITSITNALNTFCGLGSNLVPCADLANNSSGYLTGNYSGGDGECNFFNTYYFNYASVPTGNAFSFYKYTSSTPTATKLLSIQNNGDVYFSGNISFIDTGSYLDVSSNSAGIKASAGLIENINLNSLTEMEYYSVDVSLTGSVTKFNNNIYFNGSQCQKLPASNFNNIINPSGLGIFFNTSGGTGETDLLNYSQGGAGGFSFYNTSYTDLSNNVTPTLLSSIDSNGYISCSSTSTSSPLSTQIGYVKTFITINNYNTALVNGAITNVGSIAIPVGTYILNYSIAIKNSYADTFSSCYTTFSYDSTNITSTMGCSGIQNLNQQSTYPMAFSFNGSYIFNTNALSDTLTVYLLCLCQFNAGDMTYNCSAQMIKLA